MLTRVSRPRPGEPLEVCSVTDSAHDRRPGASPALPTRTRISRHAGSGTKRDARDGRSAPYPRRAVRANASLDPSRPEASANGQLAGGTPRVFVLAKGGTPLMPCAPARARQFLTQRRAVVVTLYPFTIRLRDRLAGTIQPVVLKLDPGSKTTGLAIVREQPTPDGPIHHALWLGELTHRGAQIHNALLQRANFRRRRRSANLRHRAPRFDNRIRPAGWLPPSLRHRVETVQSIVRRLSLSVPIVRVDLETVRFDTQALANPEIGGLEYQRGTLFGTEVREYLLEKWGRRCAYCDATRVPLNVDHIIPRAQGGTDRVSNLTLACVTCNKRKGRLPVQGFLAHDPARLARIRAQAQASLRDAAAVNATRCAIRDALRTLGFAVSPWSGGRTKWNRERFSLPKTHALDALCVGTVARLTQARMSVVAITACGRGSRKRTRLTAHGFPRGHLMRHKTVHGFRTGDLVRAVVPFGVHAGTHTGRVAVRTSGSFNIRDALNTVQGISHRRCRLLQRADGYAYHLLAPPPLSQERGFRRLEAL
jgi:5-methylcytosine-specific restriction endonuclease McrA